MSLIQPVGNDVRRRFLWSLISLWIAVAIAGALLIHFYAEGAISYFGLRVWLIALVAFIILAVGYMLNALKKGRDVVPSTLERSRDEERTSETGRSVKPVQALLGFLIIVMSFSLIYSLWGLWEGRHGPIAARLVGIVMSFCMILFFALALAKLRK
jgi:hypothetical protein